MNFTFTSTLRFIFSVSFMFVLSSLVLDGREAFTIEHMQVDIDVSENNVYHITERIDLIFSETRHGLIRKIPLRFDDSWVDISDIEVFGQNYLVSKKNGVCSIRIGSKDDTVHGSISYLISYQYGVGADQLPEMDEFNHNVIGLDWDTSIASAEFTIRMPKEFNPQDVNCTLGRFGSTDNSGIEWETDGYFIRGKTKRSLKSFEGITVALPLPEGYWTNATGYSRPTTGVFKLLGYPLYGLVLFISFVVWYLKGRDKRLFPSVEFSAPDGMTPAEIGYIIDQSVDPKDINSLIIYWADKGHVLIEEEAEGDEKSIKKMSITKLTELGPEAKSFERFVFRKLFTGAKNGVVTTEDLKFEFYKTINRASLDIKQYFDGNADRAIYEKSSTGWQMLIGFLSMLPSCALLLDLFIPIEGKGPLWLLAITLSGILLVPNLFSARVLTGQHTWQRKHIALILLGTLLVYGLGGFLMVKLGGIYWGQYLAASISSFIAAIFVSIVSKRTEYGDQILEKVLGFREFIKTAEVERIQTLFAENPSYYYNILPYALVLGLSDIWSSHFKKLTLSPPSWYRGHRYDAFDSTDFNRRIGASMAHMNSSLNSTPSNSGSSGSSSSGGFSGGGSGGGGGSSW